MSLPALQDHITSLPATTWASGMTLHNTGAPNLSQWNSTNAAQRIKNLENYFKNERGWSSAPHAFVDDNFVWLFTRFTDKGTHSPSWNGTRIGIEMVGDFRKGSDDDDSGRGLLVKKNTVALFAMLHTKYGWDPENIKLHKEDPRTTHDCPGDDIDKREFIDMVSEYMGHAGEHPAEPLPINQPSSSPPVKLGHVINVRNDDVLNVRADSSASARIITTYRPGAKVRILSSAINVKTKWLLLDTPAGLGWANAHYIALD